MEQIFLPFNSFCRAVNRPAWQVNNWDQLPLKDALLMLQANYYCDRYHLTDEDFDDPQQVIEYCQAQGFIGTDTFQFPKIKRKLTGGKLWTFSDKQLDHIREEPAWRETSRGIEIERQFLFTAGGIRSGKTQANVNKFAKRMAFPEMFGTRGALVAHSFSVASKIALNGEGTILDILPMASMERVDGESVKIIMPSLVYPFDQHSETFVIPVNSKRSYSAIVGLSLDYIYMCELSNILQYKESAIELHSRTTASRAPFILADSNPFKNPALNDFIELHSGHKDIELSDRFYHYSHWSIVDDTNPAVTREMQQELILQYSSDPWLLKTKIYGEWVSPTGTVLSAFDPVNNVVQELPEDLMHVNARFIIDIGHSDASVNSCWIVGFSPSEQRIKAYLIGEMYHKRNVASNIPRQGVEALPPTKLTMAILNFTEVAIRKIEEKYRLCSVELLIDPSAKGMKDNIDDVLDDPYCVYPRTSRFVDRVFNADNGSRLSRLLGGEQSGQEEAFSRMNQLFEDGTLSILNSDMFGTLDNGLPAYSTSQNVAECETFIRDRSGKIPMRDEANGAFHGDSIVCNKYFVLQLYREYEL